MSLLFFVDTACIKSSQVNITYFILFHCEAWFKEMIDFDETQDNIFAIVCNFYKPETRDVFFYLQEYSNIPIS